jgi:hypothetical protein
MKLKSAHLKGGHKVRDSYKMYPLGFNFVHEAVSIVGRKSSNGCNKRVCGLDSNGLVQGQRALVSNRYRNSARLRKIQMTEVVLKC